MVYLILTPDSLLSPIPELRALVANTGTPVEVEYLNAEPFTMRRMSDGALFNWYATSPIGTGNPVGGNYALANGPSAAGLGRIDLKAGETYTLELTVDGRIITGRTTIPDHPQPRLVVLPDKSRMVVWPRVASAGAYGLEISSDAAHTQTTTDTFYVLHDDFFPNNPESNVVVIAMDSNWARYRYDSTVMSKGLKGAYGVFGAMSRTTLALPPTTTH